PRMNSIVRGPIGGLRPPQCIHSWWYPVQAFRDSSRGRPGSPGGPVAASGAGSIDLIQEQTPRDREVQRVGRADDRNADQVRTKVALGGGESLTLLAEKEDRRAGILEAMELERALG